MPCTVLDVLRSHSITKKLSLNKWEKPDLNQQVKHSNLTLSLQRTKRHSFNFVLVRNIDNAM